MTEVLVVGAGPVGLTAAHELTRFGVRVRLIDAAAGPATTSRALAIHARTLEICDQMGVLPALLERARGIQNFTMHHRGRRLAAFGPNYSTVPTRFPKTLMLGQKASEEVLREAVRAQGVEVEWGTRLVSFEERDTRVEVVLAHADGTTERLSVPWLVGCDGGHSTVRKQLGLPLIGDSTETWLLADCDVDMDLPQNSIHWIKVDDGTVMAIPFPERRRWRLLDTVDISYDGDPDRVAQRFAAKLRKALRRDVTVHRPHWVSVFTIQQRMVPAMQAGRRFVAGDAAHVHSPASGQGMNTGMQDAFNLAWKLAMVVHGHATARLLETYSAERVPVGRALLGSTRKATRLVALRNTLAGVGLPIAFGVIRNLGPLRRKIESSIIAGMSALNLRYTDGTLIGPDSAAGGGPRPGERVTAADPDLALAPGWAAFFAELRRPGWCLVVARCDEHWLKLAARHRPWLRVLSTGSGGEGVTSLPDRDGRLRTGLGVPPSGWLVVRPDGYLAARGDTTDATAVGVIEQVTHCASPEVVSHAPRTR